MSIEAPLSKYKRNNFLIGIGVLVVFALWFGYDGYLNKKFQEENTNEDGTPNGTLQFNRKAPPFLLLGAAGLGVLLYLQKDRRLVADKDALIINGKEKIPYESIQKIDKTHFEKKGYFVATFKQDGGGEVDRKFSDRQYDNLQPILDHLVDKITG